MNTYVYPGHPVTIAVFITRYFPEIQKAFELNANRIPNAVASVDVPGAGGNVYQALDLLKTLLCSPEQFDSIIEREGFQEWERTLDQCYSDRLDSGNEQAKKLVSELREFVQKSSTH